MKSLKHIILLIILFSLSSSLFSKGIGWVDIGDYKLNKLKFDKLMSIRFSQDGKMFYSLHSTGMVYYWDTNTGDLLDSLRYEVGGVPFLSSDAKTLCYYMYNVRGPSESYTERIKIVDLLTKKITSNISINFPGDISYERPSSYGFLNSSGGFNILDYNSNAKALKAAYNIVYYRGYSNGPSFITEYYNDCGGLSVLNLLNDSIISVSEVTNNITYQTLSNSNFAYLSLFKKELIRASSSSLPTNVTTQILNTLLKRDYINKKDYKYDLQNKSILYLHLDYKQEFLYVKTKNIIYKFNTQSDSLVDSLKLEDFNGFEKLTNDGKDFIYYYKNKLVFNNVITKNYHDLLSCPITPNLLELNPVNEDIIVGNSDGTILIYKHNIDLTDVPNNLLEVPITIYPNPSSDYLNIKLKYEPLENEEVSIIDMLGQNLLTQNIKSIETSIKLTNFQTGIYYAKFKNRSEVIKFDFVK